MPGMPDQAQNMHTRERVPRSMGSGPDGQDIFCMVKDTMASKELSQDPLLVWPASLQDDVRRAFATVNDPGCPVQRCEVDDARRQELRGLRGALAKDLSSNEEGCNMVWFHD